MDADIHVIGAGIGGVAAAIALAQRGARVHILEQASELGEVGAGLQISANGMAVLRALEAVGEVPVGAVRSEGTEIRDFAEGRLVTRMPPPQAGATWYFHRADLLAVLVERATEVGVAFELGSQIAQYAADGGGCVLTMADGETRRVGLVVAADGGQSAARQMLNGATDPAFSHQVAWRALVPVNAASRAVAQLTMAPGKHVVTYPLRDGTLINIVAVEERSDWTEEGWRLQGDADDMRQRFCEFGGEVGDILQQVTAANIWALYLHPVALRWQRGCLALLGDAAHPTLPFMAQGACLALEDAWVLAECVEAHGIAGLAQYQNLRLPRARRIVATAASNAGRFHLKGPARWAAQTVLRVAGERLAPRYEWIYGHDVTA